MQTFLPYPSFRRSAAALDRIHMHEVISDTIPPWLGMRALHLSHQSNLVRKDPEHYGRLFQNVPGDLPYVWPVP